MTDLYSWSRFQSSTSEWWSGGCKFTLKSNRHGGGIDKKKSKIWLDNSEFSRLRA